MRTHDQQPPTMLTVLEGTDDFNFGVQAEDLGVNDYIPDGRHDQAGEARTDVEVVAEDLDIDIEEDPIKHHAITEPEETAEETQPELEEPEEELDDTSHPGDVIEETMHKLPIASEYVKYGHNLIVEVHKSTFATSDFDAAAALRALTVWIPSEYSGEGGGGDARLDMGRERRMEGRSRDGRIRIHTAPTLIVGEKVVGDKVELLLATTDRLGDSICPEYGSGDLVYSREVMQDSDEPYRPKPVDGQTFDQKKRSYNQLTDLSRAVLSTGVYKSLKAEMSKRQNQDRTQVERHISVAQDPSTGQTTYYWPPEGNAGDRITLNAVRERPVFCGLGKPKSQGLQAEHLQQYYGETGAGKALRYPQYYPSYENQSTRVITPAILARYNVAKHLDNLNEAFPKGDYR